MAIVNSDMAAIQSATTDKVKFAINVITIRLADTTLRELAESFGKAPYDFASLCSIGNYLPELQLIFLLHDCNIRECPILGHYETIGAEFFVLYSVGEKECPSCGKTETFYKCILATSQGYLLTECSLNTLTLVNSNIKTISDVRTHLERYYSFPKIFDN